MTDSSLSIVELRSLAVVDARGADAVTFLQGQLTNDVAGGGASRATLAGYCSPKGRLLALPLVLTLAEGGLRLIVERDLLDALLQRLRMFVLRADVVFDVRDSLRCLALTVPATGREDGEGAGGGPDLPLDHGLAGLPDVPPSEVLDVVGSAEGADRAQLLRWHDALAPHPARRYIAIVPVERGEGTAGEGGGGTENPAASDEAEASWRLGDISAGVPRIVSATREAFVPQMVNLQHVDGLSFRKGCYPGQEIVARMQYLGKLKRHMRRFRTLDAASGAAEETAASGPGDALSAEDESEGGRVVDAVTTPAGTELLAVVRIGADPASLRLRGRPLEALPLPYALPDLDGGADEASAAGAAKGD